MFCSDFGAEFSELGGGLSIFEGCGLSNFFSITGEVSGFGIGFIGEEIEGVGCKFDYGVTIGIFFGIDGSGTGVIFWGC